jgi:C1A family cysteine protease
MMKEIIRNGIVNGELQAPSIFHMYSSGVLTSNGIEQLSSSLADKKTNGSVRSKITDKSIRDYGYSWQNLNHSVVILGWGTDPVTGMKYWIVRNSYGPTWGDKGEFLVKRGSNDFGIESETTAYNFALCQEVGC